MKLFGRPLIKEVIFLTILIAILHGLAVKFSLYWIISWADIVMHFLGGFWLALFGLYIFFVIKIISLPDDHKGNIWFITLSFVLLIGLMWELWELFSGQTLVFRDRNDTILDLIMDIVGGVAGIFYGIRKIWQKK